MWNPILLVTVLTGDQFKKFNTTLLLTKFLFKRGLKKKYETFFVWPGEIVTANTTDISAPL